MKIDGFEQEKRVVVIAATNRKEDLDPALIRYSFLLYKFGCIELVACCWICNLLLLVII